MSSAATRFFLPIAIVALLSACGFLGGGGHPTASLEGTIIAVEGDSLIEWTSVTIRSRNGDKRFLLGEGVDLGYWRASHMREHMLQSDGVIVTYRDSEQGQVVEEIEHKAAGGA